LNKIKERLVSAPILVYPDWNKMFHVHINVSQIALGVVLAQSGEKMDHIVYYTRRKLSMAEKNYTTTKQEALAMVYSLQKFRHYLLGTPFKLFIDHSALKYPVNKMVIEGRRCRGLLLFQEFTFEVVFKLGRLNVGPDHLSRLETGENDGSIDNWSPDADLSRIEAIPNDLEEIVTLLTADSCPKGYMAMQSRHLVVRVVDYQLIVGHLYKMGLDQILRCCVLQQEREANLWECHAGVAEGHVGGKATVRKILHAGLWWPTIHKDSKAFAKECYVYYRVGKPS